MTSHNPTQEKPMTERKMFTKEEASALEGCVVRSVKGVAVRLLRKWPSGNFAVCYAGEDAKEYYACYDIRALTCPWDIAEVLEWPEKPEPAVDEAKVREIFIRLVYEAAMQIDCGKIQRMMKAVDWLWRGELPSVDQVRDNLMEFCAKLIRDTKKIRSMAGPWSGGWYFIVDRNTDEDGPWLRVYLGWGESGGNFEGETIT